MSNEVPDNTQPTQDENVTPRKSVILRFFSNPIVEIAGSIASILGIFLAIYFFVESKEYPELTYYPAWTLHMSWEYVKLSC